MYCKCSTIITMREIMNKSANLSISIDPKLKEEAEEILNSLGIGI